MKNFANLLEIAEQQINAARETLQSLVAAESQLGKLDELVQVTGTLGQELLNKQQMMFEALVRACASFGLYKFDIYKLPSGGYYEIKVDEDLVYLIEDVAGIYRREKIGPDQTYGISVFFVTHSTKPVSAASSESVTDRFCSLMVAAIKNHIEQVIERVERTKALEQDCKVIMGIFQELC